LDKLAKQTDEDIAKADYLRAKAELKKEEADQLISARQAFYDYKSALLQINTAVSKIKFREKQVVIYEHTTKTEDTKLTELLEEMMTLAEDRYSYVTSVSDAKESLSNMNRLIGIEGYYRSET